MQIINQNAILDKDSNDLYIKKHEEYVEAKTIEKRSCKACRITRDRRFGTNPKGFSRPKKRSVFDRRCYHVRRQGELES